MTPPAAPDAAGPRIHPRDIKRPHPRLLTDYALTSLMLGPLFPVLLVPLYFRYKTLRYDFGDDGISMSWGILFRREIHLTYARIQDIHLQSNVLERWLGLARLLIQTASGSSSAEMTIAGVRESEALRDFIYSRMRGASAEDDASPLDAAAGARPGPPSGAPGGDELTRVLTGVAEELRAIRGLLERDRSG